jgi:hypothetical protein
VRGLKTLLEKTGRRHLSRRNSPWAVVFSDYQNVSVKAMVSFVFEEI